MQAGSKVTTRVVLVRTKLPLGHCAALYTGRPSSFRVLSSYISVISSVMPLGSGLDAVPAVASGAVRAGPREFPGSTAGIVALQAGKVVLPPSMGRLIAAVVPQVFVLFGVNGMEMPPTGMPAPACWRSC